MSEEMMDRYTALKDIRYSVLNAINDLRDWTVREDTEYRNFPEAHWPGNIEQAIDDLDDAERQLLKALEEIG